MNVPTRFNLQDGIDRSQLTAILAERYVFLAEAPLGQAWTIYDTFDWRLFAQSLTLQRCGEDLVLGALSDGVPLHSLREISPPRFVWDLPEGIFKDTLSPIIKERALLELATAHTWSTTYRILNNDEKTVARLVYSQVRATATENAPPLVSTLTLLPLRGYAKQARRLAEVLQENLVLSPQREEFYFSVLRAVGKAPGVYAGKLDVRLEPDKRTGEAIKVILRQLLETMRANEAGIEADIDTEFLHDYRVAVRKTRSALSQVRKVFPPQATEHFRREFRALGKLTNDLRDLDVYLLAETDYRSMLPVSMQEDIAPLFDYLRSRRFDALTKVTAGLESEAYARTLKEWEIFLSEPVAANGAANGSVPIVELARQRIYRQYRRIVRDGNRILEHTEDELLHALRIECKKLRYLLEFFASLFPPKEIARLIRQLKRLQDNLGAFTDLSVQQEYLTSIAEALDIEDARTRRALVATGFLVERMARRQQEVKADFAGTFKTFASPSHQKQFQRLFGTRKKAKS